MKSFAALRTDAIVSTRMPPQGTAAHHLVVGEHARAVSEYVVPAVRPRDSAVDFERIPFHPVVAQEAIRAHFPDRRPAHLEGRAVRLGAHEAVVATGHPPTRGHAAAVLVLERLDDMEFEVADPCLEVLHPGLERLAAHDVPTAGGDDEILVHQAIDGVGILWLLPSLSPEVLDDCDTVLRHGGRPVHQDPSGPRRYSSCKRPA